MKPDYKIALVLFITWIALCHSLIGAERAFLNRLEKNSVVRWDDYEMPHLQVVMAGKFDVDKTELLNKLRKLLNETNAGLKGHFSKAGLEGHQLTRDNFLLPQKAIVGDQLEGIQGCTVRKCKMKLSDAIEKPKMEKSSDKLLTFHEIVLERVRRYMESAEILGYEDRATNNQTFQQMLKLTRFFPALYPRTFAYFSEPFFKKEWANAPAKDSLFRKEIVIIAPDRMQPILRVGETIEFEEGNAHVFVEPHIYTNHYFDFSMRIYEVFPYKTDPKKSVLVLTDVMEIDELKKSAIIRALYTGKMVEAVNEYQEKEIDTLRK